MNIKNIKWNYIYPLIKKHILKIFLLLFVFLVLSVLNIVFPLGVKYMFNYVVPERNIVLLLIVLLVFILTFFLMYFFYIIRANLSSVIASEIVCDVRDKVVLNLLKKSIILDKNPAEISSFLINDISLINVFLREGLFSSAYSLIVAFVFILALFFVKWQLALISSIFLPVFFFIFSFYNERVKYFYKRLRRNYEKMNLFFIDMLNNFTLLNFFPVENYFLDKHRRYNFSLKNDVIKQYVEQEKFFASAFLSLMVNFSVAIVAGAYFAMRNEFKSGDILSFYIIMQGLFNPVMHFFSSFKYLQSGSAIFEKIRDFEKSIERNTLNTVKNINIQPTGPAVAVSDLEFSYGDKLVLKKISFEIKKGEKVFIVGLNGAGKSTLLKIILGLERNYKGKVYIFGKSSDRLCKKDMLELFSYVEQGKSVFKGSLRENIALERKINGRELCSLLRSYGLDLEKIGFRIDFNGKNLSGGEKRRIAFIRGVSKKADIYVFDEPFSNQDVQGSKVIADFLYSLDGKTVICATHNLKLIKKADKILVLKDGILVEFGSYTDLMERNGYFKKLNEMFLPYETGI